MSILEPLRAGCWWEPKLSPILATVYATAALSRIPSASLWPVVALALFALAACATYVSVLNDLTDAKDDQASGKPQRWPGKSRIYPASLLAAAMAAGAGFLIAWRKDTVLVGLYLGSWLVFTLYSVRPFRLKVRGLSGVLADASGAHLFPTLFAVILLCRWSGAEAPAEWTIAVALWSFAAGVRGILWHQLEDALHDRQIGLRTFTCRHGTRAAEQLGVLAFLMECAAFAAMLWLTRNALAGGCLVFYGLFAVMRWRLLGIGLAAIKSSRSSRMAMAEYYVALYPAAYLLTLSWEQPAALMLLLLHGILFPRHCLWMAHDLLAMLRLCKSAARPKTVVYDR